jgi:hypothetical protein
MVCPRHTAPTAPIAANLRESAARLRDDIADAVQRVLSAAFGFAEPVGGNLGRLEDGRVDFGLTVATCAGNDAALDAEGGGVAALVASLRLSEIESAGIGIWAYSNSNLAMSGDERRCHQGE